MTVDPNLLKGNLDLILLTIVANGEMYGLEIIEEANNLSDGYFQFKEGSVYPALHRLTEQGFVKASFKPSPRGGMPSRYYGITPKGQKALEVKQNEFEKFTSTVKTLWGKS